MQPSMESDLAEDEAGVSSTKSVAVTHDIVECDVTIFSKDIH